MSELLDFFEFSDDYFFVVKDDEIQNVNLAFLKSLGYIKNQVIGKKITDFIVPNDYENFTSAKYTSEKVIAQVLNEKNSAIRVEWAFQIQGEYLLIKGDDVTEKLKYKELSEQYSVLLKGVNESLERSSHRFLLLQSTLIGAFSCAKNSIEKVLQMTMQTFKLHTAIVTKKAGERLVISDCVGENAECVGNQIINSNSLSKKVFNNEVELSTSLSKHEYIEGEYHLMGGKFFIGFPIFFNSKKHGTVEFVFKNYGVGSNLDNGDVQFLKLVADVIGKIVELQWINNELARKSERLKEKNNELDEFAHIISHDLKAPLRAIKNLIKFIKEEDKNKLTVESTYDFSLIEQRANRMNSLIDGVLDYSRVGREETPTSNFSLDEIVHKVVEQLQPMNPNVNFKISSNFPVMQNKELFMFQIVSNLISNAIKYNDKDTPIIKIYFKEVGEKVCLTVEDNGPGIPDQFRERVFGVFETLKGRDEIESTGIGLTIVKKMSLLMGGDTKIEDSELGGAKFVVDFSKRM